MKSQNIFLTAGLLLGSFLAMTTTAQAASFTTNFTPNNPDPKSDILLQSITQNGKTISNFSFLKSADIIYNSPKSIGINNTGAASTDKGDKASKPSYGVGPKEDPTGADIAAYLGNNNLNNIIDTEDTGSFNINVFFDSLIQADNSGLDSLFFWERGRNSDLQIQALDTAGNLIGNALTLLRSQQGNAGFRIDTTEISGSQAVGTWGVNLNQLGVTGLRGLKLTSHASFNGPDFKVVARKTPEPGVIIGLGTVATLAFLRRRVNKAVLNSAN
ncbi:exosortase-dependent surface protein XDP2 [Anabaena sp. UHCC 0451]|uniref:exosortase-dependent surface protein XDP2 n=1 Tax=Anabaena sp. UHCC 0451 TaxID=2055235 RepID=UPI002B20093A|nr:exosortase-dependent surface protein XDP2 [Anabaena sp. UHCC 0451]MEA5578546.1 exosortase-dependent surface protein XDP2 [Anabaena sp. UHCC 0451]